MSNFLKIILVICFLGSSVNITAQQKYADAYEKKGDEAFNKGNYTEALEHYTMGRKFLLNCFPHPVLSRRDGKKRQAISTAKTSQMVPRTH